MTLWLKRALAGLGVLGVGVALAAWYASGRWNSKTFEIEKNLAGALPQHKIETVSFANLEQLPPPVRRYFRRVLKEGQPVIRAARIKHAGEFRTSEEGGWHPFKSQQYFTAQPPGFVWNAGIQMAPLITVRVRDTYFNGRGSIQGKILSLISVVDEHDGGELAMGALQRFLAEAVWFPTALLPTENLKWRAIDETRALATVMDSGISVSLEFHFNEIDEITGVYSPGRYRAVNGKYELTPFAGYFRCYEEKFGMQIPVEGEVEWQLPTGKLPYWRGRIIEVEYELEQ